MRELDKVASISVLKVAGHSPPIDRRRHAAARSIRAAALAFALIVCTGPVLAGPQVDATRPADSAVINSALADPASQPAREAQRSAQPRAATIAAPELQQQVVAEIAGPEEQKAAKAALDRPELQQVSTSELDKPELQKAPASGPQRLDLRQAQTSALAKQQTQNALTLELDKPELQQPGIAQSARPELQKASASGPQRLDLRQEQPSGLEKQLFFGTWWGFHAAFVADFTTTGMALDLGCRESDPLYTAFGDRNTVGVIGSGIVVHAAVSLVSLQLHKYAQKKHGAWRYLLDATTLGLNSYFIGIHTYAAVHNYGLYREKKGS